MNSQRLQSRKFLISIFLLITATVAMFMDLADFGQWMSLSQFVVGVYTSANVIGHFNKSEGSVPADIDEELNGELAEYKSS